MFPYLIPDSRASFKESIGNQIDDDHIYEPQDICKLVDKDIDDDDMYIFSESSGGFSCLHKT